MKRTLMVFVATWPTTFAALASASPIQIDCGSWYSQPAGNWNMIPDASRNGAVGNLIDDNGIITGVGYSGSGWLGATVNYSAWDRVEDWVSERAAEDYFWNNGSGTLTITLNGLSNSGTYQVELVSAHYLTWVQDVTIGGLYADADYIGSVGTDFSDDWSIADARTNGNWMIWTSVAAVGGEVTLEFTRGSGAAIAAALRISHIPPDPATIGLSSPVNATIVTGGTGILGATVSNAPAPGGDDLNYTMTAAVTSGSASLGSVSPGSGALAPGAGEANTVAASSTNIGSNTITFEATDAAASNSPQTIEATLTVLDHFD